MERSIRTHGALACAGPRWATAGQHSTRIVPALRTEPPSHVTSINII